jgi:hypothetical protein
MRKRFDVRRYAGRRRYVGLTAITALACLFLGVGVALAVSGAVSTTDNPGYTDTGGDAYVNSACLNGQPGHTTPGTNCNIYADKRDVWLSGLPANVGAGAYFFAVLSPGGQPTPNDAATVPDATSATPKNLSDDFDAYGNRTFTVNGTGAITAYGGTHEFSNNMIQLAPYSDTVNPGGVYVLAICSLAAGVPVAAQDCKYDAFKVNPATPCTTDCTVDLAADLTGTKTATPSFTRTFAWTIAKNVNKTSVTQYNGSPTATFNYTVTVTPSFTDGTYGVGGNIIVTNPNSDLAGHDSVSGVSVTDAVLSEPNSSCTVTNGTSDGTNFTIDPANATIPDGGAVTFPYTCTYSQVYANTSQTNQATVTWPGQVLDDGNALVGNTVNPTAPIDWSNVTPALVHNCVNVTDTLYGGTLASNVCANAAGTLPATDANRTYGTGVTAVLNPTGGPYTSLDLKYSHTVVTPALGSCVTVNNRATYTATDDPTVTGHADKSVGVCNYLALTIGYWGNHLANQAKTGSNTDPYCSSKTLYSGTGCSSNGPWTKQYLPEFIGNYTVDSVPKAAQVFSLNNCSNASTSAQNALACLAAQLLGAELNVATGLANQCIVTVKDGIADANNWLKGTSVDAVAGVNYTGPTTYTLTSAQRNEALALKNVLVNYNQGGGC